MRSPLSGPFPAPAVSQPNQSAKYARNFGYMFLNAFATNFIGYGLAGLTRKFLVYPTYCLWQGALVVIALNNALHQQQHSDPNDGDPVRGPLGTSWRASRYGFFIVAFAAMFVYFWFPNYIFSALSFFNWMTWAAPANAQLTALTGMVTGLGVSENNLSLDLGETLVDSDLRFLSSASQPRADF
jgi:hypothetical protein